jgi:hypothetical protein
LLLINNDGTPPNTGRVTVLDFNGGLTQDFLQRFGESNLLDGWVAGGHLLSLKHRKGSASMLISIPE